MKTYTLAAPFLLASLSSAIPVIEPRQLPSWLSSVMPSTGTLMSYAGSMIPGQEGRITSATPKLRKNAKRDIIRYGPFTLPANKVPLPLLAQSPSSKLILKRAPTCQQKAAMPTAPHHQLLPQLEAPWAVWQACPMAATNLLQLPPKLQLLVHPRSWTY